MNKFGDWEFSVSEDVENVKSLQTARQAEGRQTLFDNKISAELKTIKEPPSA